MGKYIDLTGQKFNLLTVEKIAPPKYKNGQTSWYCTCDCGNKNIVATSSELKRGLVKSCGCLKDTFKDDLIGKKYNMLTIIKKADKDGSGSNKWVCDCDCGNKGIIVKHSDLLNGHVKSCGCLKNSGLNLIDLTGKRFGMLTVLYRVDNTITPNGKSRVTWHCKCDCGNECNVLGNYLRIGDTRSCGCLSNLIDRKKYNTYDLESKDYGIGWTSNTNKEFYFDLEDYDKIKDYTWWENDSGYILAMSNKKHIRQHRLILDMLDDNDYDIDHIHGKNTRNDNRKNNLRICTHSQNLMNVPIKLNNTSGATGVSWFKPANKWCAEIQVDKKRISLGYYDDINDAIYARKKAEEEYFGEYSYNNSINME